MQLKQIGVISLKSGKVVIEGTAAQAYLQVSGRCDVTVMS